MYCSCRYKIFEPAWTVPRGYVFLIPNAYRELIHDTVRVLHVCTTKQCNLMFSFGRTNKNTTTETPSKQFLYIEMTSNNSNSNSKKQKKIRWCYDDRNNDDDGGGVDESTKTDHHDISISQDHCVVEIIRPSREDVDDDDDLISNLDVELSVDRRQYDDNEDCFVEKRAFELYDVASDLYSTTYKRHEQQKVEEDDNRGERQYDCIFDYFYWYQQALNKVEEAITVFEILDIDAHCLGGTSVAYLLLSSCHVKLFELLQEHNHSSDAHDHRHHPQQKEQEQYYQKQALISCLISLRIQRNYFYPNHVPIHELHRKILRTLGLWSTDITIIERYISRSLTTEKIADRLYHKSKDYDEAIYEYENAITIEKRLVQIVFDASFCAANMMTTTTTTTMLGADERNNKNRTTFRTYNSSSHDGTVDQKSSSTYDDHPTITRLVRKIAIVRIAAANAAAAASAAAKTAGSRNRNHQQDDLQSSTSSFHTSYQCRQRLGNMHQPIPRQDETYLNSCDNCRDDVDIDELNYPRTPTTTSMRGVNNGHHHQSPHSIISSSSIRNNEDEDDDQHHRTTPSNDGFFTSHIWLGDLFVAQRKYHVACQEYAKIRG